MAGGKYLLGHLGTDLKGQAKFDLLCWQDRFYNIGCIIKSVIQSNIAFCGLPALIYISVVVK